MLSNARSIQKTSKTFSKNTSTCSPRTSWSRRRRLNTTAGISTAPTICSNPRMPPKSHFWTASTRRQAPKSLSATRKSSTQYRLPDTAYASAEACRPPALCLALGCLRAPLPAPLPALLRSCRPAARWSSRAHAFSHQLTCAFPVPRATIAPRNSWKCPT